MPLIAFRIVDAIRRRAACGVLEKIVVVDRFRLLTPRLAGVLELPHQFLFLGVHANSRVARATEVLALFGNVTELPIAFGVLLPRVQHLTVASLSVFLVAQ